MPTPHPRSLTDPSIPSSHAPLGRVSGPTGTCTCSSSSRRCPPPPLRSRRSLPLPRRSRSIMTVATTSLRCHHTPKSRPDVTPTSQLILIKETSSSHAVAHLPHNPAMLLLTSRCDCSSPPLPCHCSSPLCYPPMRLLNSQCDRSPISLPCNCSPDSPIRALAFTHVVTCHRLSSARGWSTPPPSTTGCSSLSRKRRTTSSTCCARKCEAPCASEPPFLVSLGYISFPSLPFASHPLHSPRLTLPHLLP